VLHSGVRGGESSNGGANRLAASDGS
jgi:hypothetical protein